MVLVLDTDDVLYLFASPAEAEGDLEAIDNEGREYEMCDENGQRYVGEITSPITAWRAGTFRLKPDGLPTLAVLSTILGRARSLDRRYDKFTTLNDLKVFIERTES